LSTLVSIIIPTYNRAYLIGETLESILAQTYTNWECIVVDDGSEDYTEELLKFYCKLDSRILFYKRPKHKRKGANACRNFGFEKSKGDYIIWFDSDDIMLPKKLKIQLDSILNNNINFSVSKFDNLINDSISKEMAFERNLTSVINAENYAMMNIFWGTIDVLIGRDLIADTKFNEDLKSGQEYNFFTKLFLSSKANGIFIDEVLSLRRLHKNSIQNLQKANQSDYLNNKFEIFYTTYLDIKDIASENVRFYLLKNCQSFSFRLATKKNNIPCFISLISYLFKEIGFTKTVCFICSIASAYTTGKGFQLLKLGYPIKL